MLIGVISDTHNHVVNIEKAVTIFNERGVALVLHAGDFTAPSSLIPLLNLKSDFIGVYGNNDDDLLQFLRRTGLTIHRQPHEVRFHHHRIALVHEPDLVAPLTKSGRFGIVVYGHTHRPLVSRDNEVLLVNPGFAGSEKQGKATIGIIHTDNLTAEILTIS